MRSSFARTTSPPARPFGAGLIEAEPGRTQDYLAHEVKRGDPIDLRLFHVRDAEEPIPFYRALHNGYDVGETSEELGRALARRLQRTSASTNWPTHLTGAICDGSRNRVGHDERGQLRRARLLRPLATTPTRRVGGPAMER